MKKPTDSTPPRYDRSAGAAPHWATRLLRSFCSPDLVDELEGDLDELFQQRVE
ncbi:MAG: hypothetical protein H7Y12_16150, partial [Sphingobacteriaceae bacterium]|nr:hypothetical protein [Cytophagaceae bacterium]